MQLDMSKFKTTIPAGYKSSTTRAINEKDPYIKLAEEKHLVITKGEICIGKTVNPIGLVDVFSEKKEVITELRKPNKMATLGEMRRIWDHVNQDLYNKLIESLYLNA